MSQASASQALSRFLRLEPAAAAALAARVAAEHADLGPRLRQQASPRQRRRREACSGLPPPAHGPVVVALAFSRSPLLWLQRLSLLGARPLQILRTELSESHLREHARCHGRLALRTPLEMIRHRADRADGTVFVTFPDHTVGSGNTNVQVPLFGEAMLFQTLESLLARKHDAGLYRCDGERLEPWGPAAVPRGAGEHCLTAEAAWLAAGVERTIMAAPEQYFGWERIARKCPRFLQNLQLMRLDVLKGFLRSWAWRVRLDDADALGEILALIDRDGPALLEAQGNAGLRLAGG